MLPCLCRLPPQGGGQSAVLGGGAGQGAVTSGGLQRPGGGLGVWRLLRLQPGGGDLQGGGRADLYSHQQAAGERGTPGTPSPGQVCSAHLGSMAVV